MLLVQMLVLMLMLMLMLMPLWLQRVAVVCSSAHAANVTQLSVFLHHERPL
jgi:hypothetical protein